MKEMYTQSLMAVKLADQKLHFKKPYKDQLWKKQY